MIKVLGIVGAEAAKFTKAGEDAARTTIREYIARLQPAMIVSGECHLGGVDIWAKEEAAKAGLAFHGFPPKDHHWLSGYKPRNLDRGAVRRAVGARRERRRARPPHARRSPPQNTPRSRSR